MSKQTRPFWKCKSLDQMSHDEWESLCDGCARCCLVKLEDEDSGAWHLTRLACGLLDRGNCRCKDYENRFSRMPDCVSVNPAKIAELDWLPDSCAYRKVANGEDLDWWHPLVSGRRETVHDAGISVRGWTLSEHDIQEEDWERYIIRRYPAGK